MKEKYHYKKLNFIRRWKIWSKSQYQQQPWRWRPTSHKKTECIFCPLTYRIKFIWLAEVHSLYCYCYFYFPVCSDYMWTNLIRVNMWSERERERKRASWCVNENVFVSGENTKAKYTYLYRNFCWTLLNVVCTTS